MELIEYPLAVLALIFDLKELVDFMSIGTLMAYTLVAASVMILRYRASDDDVPEPISDEPLSFQDFFKPRSNSPNQISTKVVTINSAILSKYTFKHGMIVDIN